MKQQLKGIELFLTKEQKQQQRQSTILTITEGLQQKIILRVIFITTEDLMILIDQ